LNSSVDETAGSRREEIAFHSRGVAVYSFDKPGIGGSSGDWRHFALFDRADQAQAALTLVQAHTAVDSRRVGVWGQSQGGWIVQLVASRTDNLAFAITNSGPAISPREQDIYGVEHTLRAEGRSPEDVERAIVFEHALHEAATRGDDFASVSSALLHEAMGQPWSGYHALESPDSG
jgi:pimeloyl-ACP methyl ester carboxylesterase